MTDKLDNFLAKVGAWASEEASKAGGAHKIHLISPYQKESNFGASTVNQSLRHYFSNINDVKAKNIKFDRSYNKRDKPNKLKAKKKIKKSHNTRDKKTIAKIRSKTTSSKKTKRGGEYELSESSSDGGYNDWQASSSSGSSSRSSSSSSSDNDSSSLSSDNDSSSHDTNDEGSSSSNHRSSSSSDHHSSSSSNHHSSSSSDHHSSDDSLSIDDGQTINDSHDYLAGSDDEYLEVDTTQEYNDNKQHDSLNYQ